MVKLDDLNFLLALVEHIQDGAGGLGYLLNLSIGNIGVFLFVQKLYGLCGFHVEPPVKVSLSLFVGDSVCDQGMFARWLLIEHEEVEIVSVFFVGNDQQ